MSEKSWQDELQTGAAPADAAPQDAQPKPETVSSGEPMHTSAEPEQLSEDGNASADLEAEDFSAAQTKSEGSAEEAAARESVPEEKTAEAPEEEPATEEKHSPAYRTRRQASRSKNPSRKWGVLLGVTLGLLCCGCITLLAGFALNAGWGGAVLPSTGGQTSDSSGSVSETPADPEQTHLQVYDVPSDEDGYTTQYIVDQVQDSVVGILMYDGTGIDPVGAGTGIIMSEDGYIITNAHVVVDATGLTVVLYDETKYSAIVVGYDEKTDLAVIKINATGLHPAEFGDSSQVVVGERAIAIGNPGGLSNSVSQGIISGKDREIAITLSDGSVSTLTALQTDAAINPGNSGGPLLNAWGQVVGINSSKIVKTGYEGIGFAIPVNEAQPVIDNLIQYGYVRDRAVLGITVIALDAVNGPANGLPSQGLYIASIAEYSDFNNLGILAGDVILSANGVEVASVDDLSAQLKLFRPGDTISMEIYRAYDGSTVTVQVLLLDSRAAG